MRADEDAETCRVDGVERREVDDEVARAGVDGIGQREPDVGGGVDVEPSGQVDDLAGLDRLHCESTHGNSSRTVPYAGKTHGEPIRFTCFVPQIDLDVTEARRQEQTDRVLTTNPQYAGPLIFAVALVVILLLCRWVFTPNHSAPRAPQERGDYGLLVPITVVRTVDDAQMLRDLLREAGIRGTIADADGGHAVLVFHDDAERAKQLVRS